jgi:hypothetical protein
MRNLNEWSGGCDRISKNEYGRCGKIRLKQNGFAYDDIYC